VPNKKNDKCPVVLAFHSRLFRSLLFKYRKEAAPTTNTEGKIKPTHPFFEDLTTATFSLYRSFHSSPDVQSVWSMNGQIRFRMKDSEFVHKVQSLSDTVDSFKAKS
jgi:hypothetical protein